MITADVYKRQLQGGREGLLFASHAGCLWGAPFSFMPDFTAWLIMLFTPGRLDAKDSARPHGKPLTGREKGRESL